MNKVKKFILKCIKNEAKSTDEIISEGNYSEREVKEAIWDLIYKKKIKPNKYWRLEINES